MRDYTELVKNLRNHARNFNVDYDAWTYATAGQLFREAADAIQELTSTNALEKGLEGVETRLKRLETTLAMFITHSTAGVTFTKEAAEQVSQFLKETQND